MKIGRMNERIELQYKVVAIDAVGQESITWTTLGTVWASLTYSSTKADSDEKAVAGQITDMNMLKFTIRFDRDITQDNRIVWRGNNYDIVGVTHYRKDSTTLRAFEGIKDGR